MTRYRLLRCILWLSSVSSQSFVEVVVSFRRRTCSKLKQVSLFGKAMSSGDHAATIMFGPSAPCNLVVIKCPDKNRSQPCFSKGSSDADGEWWSWHKTVATVTQEVRITGFYGFSRKSLKKAKHQSIRLVAACSMFKFCCLPLRCRESPKDDLTAVLLWTQDGGQDQSLGCRILPASPTRSEDHGCLSKDFCPGTLQLSSLDSDALFNRLFEEDLLVDSSCLE